MFKLSTLANSQWFQTMFQGQLPKETLQKIFNAVSSSVASIGIKQLFNILFIPVVISQLGFESFSLLMLLIGVQEICLFLDCGMTQTMITLLSQQPTPRKTGWKRPHFDSNQQTFSLAVSYGFYTVIAGIIIIATIFISPAINVIFHIPQYLEHTAQTAFLLLMLEGALFLLSSYYRGTLMAHCNHAIINYIDTFYHVVAFGGGLGFVLLGFGLEGLMTARMAAAIIRWAALGYTAKQSMPKTILLPVIKQPQQLFNTALNFYALGKHAVINNISIILSHKVDTIVIGLFLPLSAVGVYEIVFRLLGTAQQLCMKMSEILLSLFASASKRNENNTAQFLFLKNSSFNQMVIATLVILIIAFYPALLNYLTHNTLSVQQTWLVFTLAIPIIWSAVLQIPASGYLFTSGHESYLAKSSIITALCNLVLSLLLVKPLGLIGVVLGTFIPQLIQHQYYLIAYTCKALKISIEKYMLAVYWKGLVPVLFSGMLLFTFLMFDLGKANLITMAITGIAFSGINFLLWTNWRLDTLQSLLIKVEININHLNQLKQKISAYPLNALIKKAGVS